MLELIYHPENKFIKMEENPLDSIDMAYGIPIEFNQIFDSINDFVNREDDDEDEFEYIDVDEEEVDVADDQFPRRNHNSSPLRKSKVREYDPLKTEQSDDDENFVQNRNTID